MVNTKLQKPNLLDKLLFYEVIEDRETYQAVISILLENGSTERSAQSGSPRKRG